MCGIAGYIENGQGDKTTVLEGMLTSIAYRGPDDRGIWTADNIGLGHVRLSVMDLSKLGHQPFITTDGKGVLIYNGEVYNFLKLRDELKGEGCSFRSETDTEVVLYALHLWGPEQAVTRLNGMFAFAYYDLRDKSLWLSRDRAGMKPLYIARSGNTFAFASEQKALFAHPKLSPEPDLHSVAVQLLYERLEGTMAPYKGVESLLPGSLLQIKNGCETSTTYFDVLRDVNPQRIIKNSTIGFDQHFADFETAFSDSVKMHLNSDAELATMCSGGLDSGLITTFAKRIKPDIVAYVADVEGMAETEVRRAKIICDATNVELRPVNVDTEAYFRALPYAILSNDQPLYFSQNVISMVVAQKIHRDGFKVVLAGDGADEIYGGYSWHVSAYRSWRWRRIQSRWIGNNVLTRALGKITPILKPVDLKKLQQNPFSLASYSEKKEVNPIGPFLIDGGSRHLRQRDLFHKLKALPRLEDRAYLARGMEDMYVHMREAIGSVDKMAMRHSVEVRLPFLENHLIDFGIHQPLSSKYHRGTTKRLVKKLAERHLPRKVVHLPKIGYGIKPRMWQGLTPFLKNGRVADMFKWRPDKQSDILLLLQSQPYAAFRMLSTELWFRLCIDGESPDSLSERLLEMKLQSASKNTIRP